MRRVFISGIGVVCPIGNTKAAFWDALIGGRCGVRTLQSIDIKDLPVTIGGEVVDLDVNAANVNDKVNARKMDRSSIFAVISAAEALRDAGLDSTNLGDRCGVVVGSGLSGLATLQEQTENLLSRGPRGVSPFTIPILMPNAAPANVSLAFNVTGPAYTVASACSSSGHAFIDAFEMLRREEVDVVLVGGSESSLTRLGISAFANMRAMTKKYNDCPEKASRPFDADRDGFVMSEGGAMLILESDDHLAKRSGRPIAEIVGYGSTMDSHHLVQPDPSAQGAIRAIRQALRMAGWDPEKIAGRTYVNAHGTSTKYNDLAETIALKEIFGPAASRLQISSTKGSTGHLIGAACAVEMAACMLAFEKGILPPTINYETPDPECDLDYIPNKSREASVDFALNNSFGFGGHNVCIAIAKPGASA
ncbi:MAG: beta-ketoacyl-ACP synthase II [Planctomycetota bacterium]